MAALVLSTVVVSIVVHGVTATPLSTRWLEGHKRPERL